MSSVVQHLPGQNRYVFEKDGKQVGLTDYEMHGHAIHITHTEVDPHLRHSGVGSEMVQEVVETIRTSTDYRVVPDCPFALDWFEHHPEYHELELRG